MKRRPTTGRFAAWSRPSGLAPARPANATANHPTRRARLDAILEALPVLAFDAACADAYGRIVESAGYSRRKLLDRMIAAQAIVHNASVVTQNADDFADIPALNLLAW